MLEPVRGIDGPKLGPQAADVGSEPGDRAPPPPPVPGPPRPAPPRPPQPTRSASTVAGIPGSTANRARTRPSNGENDVTSARRSYFGGALDATAFTTVVLEIPNRAAIWAFGTPSAASLRINAQSSKVITLQSSSVHFSSVETVQFSNVVNTHDDPQTREVHPISPKDGRGVWPAVWGQRQPDVFPVTRIAQ
jgi:hypothetical protein